MSEPVVIPDALAGVRVDRALAELLDVPVNAARRLIAADRVRVDGRRVAKGDVVTAGAHVVVSGEGGWLLPKADAALVVLHVDARVVVVSKPAGMPSHPLVPGEGGTAVDAVAALFPEVASASTDPREAGLVHRLDTGTSGCLAVARDRGTWTALRAAFAAGEVDKRYLALVEGTVRAPLVLTADLAHDPRDGRRMVTTTTGGIAAVTTATPLGAGPRHSLVSVAAARGRRHQVRVHLASAGHPLVGDVLYGAAPAADAPFHMLHALRLALPGVTPVTAPVPSEFEQAAAARGLAVPSERI